MFEKNGAKRNLKRSRPNNIDAELEEDVPKNKKRRLNSPLDPVHSSVTNKEQNPLDNPTVAAMVNAEEKKIPYKYRKQARQEFRQRLECDPKAKKVVDDAVRRLNAELVDWVKQYEVVRRGVSTSDCARYGFIAGITGDHSISIKEVRRDQEEKDSQREQTLRKTIKELVEYGADVNQRIKVSVGIFWTEREETLLHHVARKGAVNIIKLLVDNGADINAKDSDGNCPFDVLFKSREVANHYTYMESLLKPEEYSKRKSNECTII